MDRKVSQVAAQVIHQTPAKRLHCRYFGGQAVGAVVHPRHGHQLAFHTGCPEPIGIVDGLVVEQVKIAHTDPCRCQAGQGNASARCGVRGASDIRGG